MNATVVQNVVTYNTVINFDNPDLKLFPGMTAYVTIPVASATKVLKIPNGSLRFKPDMKADEIRALYTKYGIEDRGATRAAAADHSGGGGGATGRQARATGEGNVGGGAGGQGNTQAQTRGPRMDVAIVWKLRSDKTLEPVRVRTGITDHTVTEVAQVLNGQLNDGDDVITGSMAASANRPPSMGGPTMRR
jgi:HlyD family secretion protein